LPLHILADAERTSLLGCVHDAAATNKMPMPCAGPPIWDED
jgi:hypothetical protein